MKAVRHIVAAAALSIAAAAPALADTSYNLFGLINSASTTMSFLDASWAAVGTTITLGGASNLVSLDIGANSFADWADLPIVNSVSLIGTSNSYYNITLNSPLSVLADTYQIQVLTAVPDSPAFVSGTLKVSSVPEADSIAMAFGGLAVVGALAVRRRPQKELAAA